VRLAAVAACVAALVAAPFVLAQVTNRYVVATDPAAKGYPRNLAVVFVSPPKYVLDYMGRGGNDAAWKGPRYQATERASLGGLASLGWSAGVYREPSNQRTILAHLVHDWEVIQRGTEPIERRVGGRAAGTIRGTWLLTQGSVMAGEARYEAGLVFPLCGRTLLVNVSALTPSGDSAGGSMGFGEYVIEGMKPTEWNKLQVLETLKGIRLEGNLPAGLVTVARRGGRIAGKVTDCNRHPLAAQAVVLERRSGSSWTRAAAGKTTAAGTYSLRFRGAGTYRVVAGGKRSAPVRIA